jgi:fumarate hydratase subunit beta
VSTARTTVLDLPLPADRVAELHAGDQVRLNGTLLTARDAAHKRLVDALAAGRPTPVPLNGATIYYTGPTPAPPGRAIGSAGPTTGYRMDPYTEPLLCAGVRCMIGKGARGPDIAAALQRHGAVYCVAIGGAGALLSESITACRVVAYADLGPEAIHELTVADLPLIVAQDMHGESVYAQLPTTRPH